MPSKDFFLCRPLFLLPSIFPSIRVFSNESALRIRWPKYWSFSFNISPSNEHPELISFRMDWLDLLAVQGTLKSLLQHHSSKASVFWRSAFFIVQLSHPYMTTGNIGEGNGNPFQCSCLENPRDRGAWWASVYGVAQSRTRLKQLSSSSPPWMWHFSVQQVTMKNKTDRNILSVSIIPIITLPLQGISLKNEKKGYSGSMSVRTT